jgi:hypothetical protein
MGDTTQGSRAQLIAALYAQDARTVQTLVARRAHRTPFTRNKISSHARSLLI